MRYARRLTALAAVTAVLVPLAGACGSDDDASGIATGAAEWTLPNGDASNTRVVLDSAIDAASVDELAEAWRVPIRGAGTFGNFASTSLIVDGVVYTQDLRSNVSAIDLETGEVRWEKAYDSPTVGPNGLAYADGRLFGATVDEAFAVDAESGEQVWISEKLTRNANEGIDIAPGVHDGLVYVSTVPVNTRASYRGNGQGILHALDAETGEEAWTFDTVPADLWSAEHTDINSGGGLWHPPAFDDDGAMYISIANPAPFLGTDEFPWGSSRPGPNPDTNTLVKMDAATGEVIWRNQVLPHDVYDWDLHLPPILTSAGGRDLVLTGGKMGYVYAMDRESGELVWKTSVGEHSGNDDDNELALAEEFDRLPSLPFTLLPGFLGGVETQMAVADGVVYAPVVNLPVDISGQEEFELDFGNSSGEMVALDVATGDVLWQRDFDAPVYGAATVVNDLVFTTTFDGTVHALNRDDGTDAWTSKLPAGTNATLSASGDWLVTAASVPQAPNQRAAVVAYRLGGGGAATTAPTTTGATTGATTTGTTTGTTTAAAPTADESAQTFATNCASCHTLAAADATGKVGPNLDRSTLDVQATADKITNGGGLMPAFGSQFTEARPACHPRSRRVCDDLRTAPRRRPRDQARRSSLR